MNRLMIVVLLLFLSSCAAVRPTPTVEAASPEVRCKQPPTAPVPAAPRKDKWIEWRPPLPGEKQGVARLSEAAARWIVDVLGIAEKEKGLRAVEHKCLDDLEKQGLITQ